jgi:hypothetical protein
VRKFKSHLAVTLGIIAPVLADLDEQEQVHLLLEALGDFLARCLADGLDGLALVASTIFFWLSRST